MRSRFRVPVLCLCTLLAACNGAAESPARAAMPHATGTPGLSPALQAVYDRSCKTCHSSPATGAPQSGDAAAWAARAAQGTDVLLDHTINGYKAMPPLGACMDCDEEQFRALIAHMARLEPTP